MGVRLGVDPSPPEPGSGWSDASRRALAHDAAMFKAAFDAGAFADAATWAGGIAVAMEKRDDPGALAWWNRERWLRARIEAGWDGSCDREDCAERATKILVGEWHPDHVPTFCSWHAVEEMARAEEAST